MHLYKKKRFFSCFLSHSDNFLLEKCLIFKKESIFILFILFEDYAMENSVFSSRIKFDLKFVGFVNQTL